MANLGATFDSGHHDDMNSGFDPMPADEYIAQVVESEVLQTSKKTGKYIKLKFAILKGEFKGRFVWSNLNIVNPNPITVEIAQKELATLCRACGKAVIQDTQELHGIPILMKIKIKPAKDDYPAGNIPIGYKSATVGATAQNPSQPEGSESTPPPIEDGDVPWE